MCVDVGPTPRATSFAGRRLVQVDTKAKVSVRTLFAIHRIPLNLVRGIWHSESDVFRDSKVLLLLAIANLKNFLEAESPRA
jgi:hypothetical protein